MIYSLLNLASSGFLLKKRTCKLKLLQGVTEHYQWLSGFPTFLLFVEGAGGGILKSCGDLLAFISVP